VRFCRRRARRDDVRTLGPERDARAGDAGQAAQTRHPRDPSNAPNRELAKGAPYQERMRYGYR